MRFIRVATFMAVCGMLLVACGASRPPAASPAASPPPTSPTVAATPFPAGAAVVDPGGSPATSCHHLLRDYTLSGVCIRKGHRYLVGARGDAVRVGTTQLTVASVDATRVIPRPGNESDDSGARAQGHFFLVEIRVFAPGPRQLLIQAVENYGIRLRVAGRVVEPDSAAFIAAQERKLWTDASVAPGQSQTILLGFDVDQHQVAALAAPIVVRVPGSIRTPFRSHLPRPALEFVDADAIPVQLHGHNDQVDNSGTIGVLRLPPLRR